MKLLKARELTLDDYVDCDGQGTIGRVTVVSSCSHSQMTVTCLLLNGKAAQFGVGKTTDVHSFGGYYDESSFVCSECDVKCSLSEKSNCADPYCWDCHEELSLRDDDHAEYMANQDVSPEQLAGEQFQDRYDMYRNEY